ncbi:MAG: hypothetical protein K4305_09070 [Chlorobium sp.]|uniref:hypothetical protein n=1 Tax=Chlorobium sp. TaxID=1095 RepID=UPI002F3EE056
MKQVLAAVVFCILAGCGGSGLISVKDPDVIITPSMSGVWLSLSEFTADVQVLSDSTQGKRAKVKFFPGLVMYYPSPDELKELTTGVKP